jgi:hypothetical protein
MFSFTKYQPPLPGQRKKSSDLASKPGFNQGNNYGSNSSKESNKRVPIEQTRQGLINSRTPAGQAKQGNQTINRAFKSPLESSSRAQIKYQSRSVKAFFLIIIIAISIIECISIF